MFAAFIDLRKAFDLVRRDLLREKMIKVGYTPQFVDLILGIYNNLSLSVRVGGKNFGSVKTVIGLPQPVAL